MSIATSGELAEFVEFITTRLNGKPTPERAVVAFREYQEQKERFLRESHEAFEQMDRGECKPLDRDEFKRRMIEELAKEGIVDD